MPVKMMGDATSQYPEESHGAMDGWQNEVEKFEVDGREDRENLELGNFGNSFKCAVLCLRQFPYA